MLVGEEPIRLDRQPRRAFPQSLMRSHRPTGMIAPKPLLLLLAAAALGLGVALVYTLLFSPQAHPRRDRQAAPAASPAPAKAPATPAAAPSDNAPIMITLAPFDPPPELLNPESPPDASEMPPAPPGDLRYEQTPRFSTNAPP